MARLPILVKKDILLKAYEKWQIQVPITKIKQQLGLNISLPTLAKLIDWLDLANLLKAQSNSTNNELVAKIFASLFPEFVKFKNGINETTPPSNYQYKGLMPFGNWKKLN